jgi:hypothetical protein
VLQLAPSEPAEGESVTAIGYPGSVDDVTDISEEPSFKTGHVSALQTSGGVPFIQTDAAFSAGMSGGAARRLAVAPLHPLLRDVDCSKLVGAALLRWLWRWWLGH